MEVCLDDGSMEGGKTFSPDPKKMTTAATITAQSSKRVHRTVRGARIATLEKRREPRNTVMPIAAIKTRRPSGPSEAVGAVSMSMSLNLVSRYGKLPTGPRDEYSAGEERESHISPADPR